MRSTLYRIFLLYLTPLFLVSCFVSYGDNTYSQFTMIHPHPCPEYDSAIYLFFEGEVLNLKYKKIGQVEVQGERHATNEEILNHLKYAAWQNCANGLINIKGGYKERDEGYLFNEGTKETYSSKYYTAIAVKIKIDSAFISEYGEGGNLGFVKQVEKYKEKQNKKSSNQVAASMIGGFVGLILIILGVTSS